jgi:hypothetical protein
MVKNTGFCLLQRVVVSIVLKGFHELKTENTADE